MKPLHSKLLIVWLLAALLLTSALPFSGMAGLGRGLLLAVAITSPLVVWLLLSFVVRGLREAFCRWRVLRRARKWKRKEPLTPWTGQEWDA